MHIRSMQLSDIKEVAALSEQLGYPTDEQSVKQRFEAIQQDASHAFMVAQTPNGDVVGWVHVYGVYLLESDGYAEIGGLVVSTGSRRQGIGRALMAAAEKWASERNYPEVRLRSGLQRTEAHLFYQNIGYTLAKTSHMFRKRMTD